jgi:hypothetical protein
MRRLVAGLLAVSVMAAVVVISASARSAGHVRQGSWSSVYAIGSPTAFVSAPQVAVGDAGRAVIGWESGPPPEVRAGPGAASRAAARDSTDRSSVMAATGTLPTAIGEPVILSSPGANVEGGPEVAMAGSGVAYLAWPQTSRLVWMVSAVQDGQHSKPRRLGVPAGAQLQELASAGAGRVAAVWLQYRVHSAPAFRYALLRRSGSIGRVVTIAHLGSPLESVHFAINDRGAVLASWVNTGKPFGNQPRVSAERCDPTGRCAERQTVGLGRPLGQDLNDATTLSDDGAASILISGYGPGLEAAVSHGNQPFPRTSMVSATGEQQVSAAQGAGGAMAAFYVGGIPVRTLAWSRLPSGRDAFTAPRILSRSATDAPVVAGNPGGDVAMAWTQAPLGEITEDSYSIHALTGGDGTLTPATTIARGAEHIAAGTLATGIDHRGEAIVVWSRFTPSGSQGVFASTYTP